VYLHARAIANESELKGGIRCLLQQLRVDNADALRRGGRPNLFIDLMQLPRLMRTAIHEEGHRIVRMVAGPRPSLESRI
jgi:hypothetical protein